MAKNWSYERMTNLGAVVCQIQSVCAVAFSIFFLEMLLNKKRDIPVLGNDRLFLNYLTKDIHTMVFTLLVLSCIFHLIWFVSSVSVTCGNQKGIEKSISQSLVVTSVISLLDIFFPFIMISSTISVFNTAMDRRPVPINELDDDGYTAEIKADSFGIYFLLLMSFMRGGCLTFAINMLYLYVAYQRFMELKNTRIVVGQRFKSPKREIGEGNFELRANLEPKPNYFDDSTLQMDPRQPDEETRLRETQD